MGLIATDKGVGKWERIVRKEKPSREPLRGPVAKLPGFLVFGAARETRATIYLTDSFGRYKCETDRPTPQNYLMSLIWRHSASVPSKMRRTSLADL